MRLAFDADVLIYAVTLGHEMTTRIRGSLDAAEAAYGSVLLLHEIYVKPMRYHDEAQVEALGAIVARMELAGVTEGIANFAVDLGITHGLKTVDAVHLATALASDADAFVTNNRKDFRRDRIVEIDVLYPEDLPVA